MRKGRRRPAAARDPGQRRGRSAPWPAPAAPDPRAALPHAGFYPQHRPGQRSPTPGDTAVPAVPSLRTVIPPYTPALPTSLLRAMVPRGASPAWGGRC